MAKVPFGLVQCAQERLRAGSCPNVATHYCRDLKIMVCLTCAAALKRGGFEVDPAMPEVRSIVPPFRGTGQLI
jgi:hypothetical protein